MYSAAHAVGGQSVPKFDYDLAPGVRKTFTHRYLDNIARLIYFNTDLEIGEIQDVVKSSYKEMTDDAQRMLSLSTISAKYQECERANIIRGFIENGSNIDRDYLFDLLCESQNKAWMMAEKETDRATYQAMEALVHNLNTMHSRAGAQVPFSSINYGTDTSPEGRMVIKNILLALEAGLGNGETPIFPIHIFKVKEGVNYNPKDPNYDLFKLSCEVSAKRLFPNFSFIDAPFNKQFYKKGDPNTEIAYMGCRTRVISNVNGPEVVTSRGNLSFTSINLPRLAIMGALNDPHNGTHTAVETFFELLDEMLNHAIDQLMHRFRIQCQRKVKNHPFLMGQGVWMDSEKLSPDDTLEEVLKHGSLSVGFIGLAEALKVLTGYHHGESKEAWDLGYKIIKHMRDRMDEEAEKTKLNFSLLATPAEGLCLAGDTLVQTPYGNKKIKDIAEGDQVFSYNLKTHKIEIDVVAKSQMTSPKRKVMKITFDTGQEVICTPNHPFAVRTINRDKYGRIIKIDGFTESIDFVNAEDLKVGNRIKSNYIELSNSGYYRFKNNEFIHKMVYEFYNGPIPKGYVVHHKNEKKHDNSIDNLMLMSAKEHRILHMRDTIGKFCYTSTSQQGENNSFYGKKHSEFVKKLISESKILDRNVSNLIKDYFDGIKTDMLAEKYNVSEISICRKLRQRGVSLEANHIITKIEYLEDEIPVYDITMTNNSNFFVGGDRGILVHNSGRFVKIDAERFGKIPEVTDREYYTNSFHQWWLDTYVSRKSA